jgi:isopenicillin-N epimerase
VNRPARSDLAHHWTLDPSVVFLNHGSFGATPRPVLEKQTELRARLEAQPVRFMVRELEPMLDEARHELAAFVGADPIDLAFVPNATTGVNAVLRSLDLSAGDELLTTTHEYNACKNALLYVAARTGARVVFAELPFPVKDPSEIVDAIVRHVGPRTRLLLVDHVTSPTAMVLPIEQIVRAVEALGVPVLVDGAHAPGMVDIDLRALDASYYTANCHKWLCAPKGCAMLWVRREHQAHVRPPVTSHGANSPREDRSRFLIEFDWTGTDDPTAYLCIGECIRFMGSLVPGGWPALRAKNRALAIEARRTLERAMGAEPVCPESMVGAMAAVSIPDGRPEGPRSPLYLDPLQDELLGRFGVEVPIVTFPAPPKRLVRVSAQLYNTLEEHMYLADALLSLVGRVT